MTSLTTSRIHAKQHKFFDCLMVFSNNRSETLNCRKSVFRVDSRFLWVCKKRYEIEWHEMPTYSFFSLFISTEHATLRLFADKSDFSLIKLGFFFPFLMNRRKWVKWCSRVEIIVVGRWQLYYARKDGHRNGKDQF